MIDIEVEKKKTGHTLGIKLAYLSKLKGYTQDGLSLKTKMARITINRFYKGHTQIRAEDLADLLFQMGIDLDGIIDSKIAEQIESMRAK